MLIGIMVICAGKCCAEDLKEQIAAARSAFDQGNYKEFVAKSAPLRAKHRNRSFACKFMELDVKALALVGDFDGAIAAARRYLAEFPYCERNESIKTYLGFLEHRQEYPKDIFALFLQADLDDERGRSGEQPAFDEYREILATEKIKGSPLYWHCSLRAFSIERILLTRQAYRDIRDPKARRDAIGRFAEKALERYKGTRIEWRVSIETAGSRGSDHEEPHPTENLIAAAKGVIPGLTGDDRSYARLELADFYRRYQEHFAKTEAEKESFHEAAKRERRKIIEENPQWVHLGLVVQFEASDMIRRGKYNEVKHFLEQYEKLLRKDYRYWVSWADLALAMAHRDDWLMAAKEIAEKVIREFPDSVPAEIAQQALSQIGDEIGRVIGPMKPLVPPVTPESAQAKPGAETAAKPPKPAPAPVIAAPGPPKPASQPTKPMPWGRPLLLIAVIGGAVIISGAGLLFWFKLRRTKPAHSEK